MWGDRKDGLDPPSTANFLVSVDVCARQVLTCIVNAHPSQLAGGDLTSVSSPASRNYYLNVLIEKLN
jgi:hypothetical protein